LVSTTRSILQKSFGNHNNEDNSWYTVQTLSHLIALLRDDADKTLPFKNDGIMVLENWSYGYI
jgi:hypothetical protein